MQHGRRIAAAMPCREPAQVAQPRRQRRPLPADRTVVGAQGTGETQTESGFMQAPAEVTVFTQGLAG
jgi:hypothetical protein